jgi:hypothetical protein
MENIRSWELKESFERFERAAAKGHEESIWIVSVVKGVEMTEDDYGEAFAKTEKPLGWYLAGKLSLSNGTPRFDFFKKSAEGGCSWGEVGYAWYFQENLGAEALVKKDDKVYLGMLEKAATDQNNPKAMYCLGYWLKWKGKNPEKAVSYIRPSAELGWNASMVWLADLLKQANDLSRAVRWSAQGNSRTFFEILEEGSFAAETNSNLEAAEFNQLSFTLGWGLYWYKYGTLAWMRETEKDQQYGDRCIDFYCATMELQQESIFTFLWFWNQTVGVKDVGTMIGKMVWEEDRNVWLNRLWRKAERK